MSSQPLLEDKETTGLALSQSPVGIPCSQMELCFSRANRNEGKKPRMTTGKCLSLRRRNNPLEESKDCLELIDLTGSSPDQAQQKNTYGKRQHELESNSNLENVRYEGTPVPIGKRSKRKQSKATLTASRLMFTLDTTELSVPSRRTIVNRLRWNERLWYSGVKLVLENHVELGPKPVMRHLLKIHGLNFGVGTEVKRTVLSMSSEEESTFHICLDGSTGTHATWKLKEAQDHFVLNNSGSPRTFIRKVGTQE